MDYDEQRPVKRRFQYRLKSLMLLPVVVGVPVAFYAYWVDWKKQRPPYKEFDDDGFRTAFVTFVEDLAAGRLAHAYDSTTPRFKKQMSRSEFDDLIRRNPAVQAWPNVWGLSFPLPEFGTPARRWSTHMIGVMKPDGNVTELWVWVVTDESDDSFFHRRPPPPRVEEIQIRDVDSPRFNHPLKPSWDQK